MEPFASVPEQPEAKRLLAAALAEDSAHAYLLHGPAGVGKRTAAFAFAGVLLGDESPWLPVWQQRAELGRDENDDGVWRRLLEVLQERVGRVFVHAIGVEDEIHAAVGFERPHVQVVAQGAYVVDTDHLAERLEQVQVGMRARYDATLVPEQHSREGKRRGPLSHPCRTV